MMVVGFCSTRLLLLNSSRRLSLLRNIMSNAAFEYFAFGSNLLQKRIHILNPSAVFRTTARLDGYRLEFDNYIPGKAWHGASATITKAQGEHVWGVIWTLDESHRATLDSQEGVDEGIYEAFSVDVTSPKGEVIGCRTYSLLKRGSQDRRPSPQYLDVIIRGAIEHNLPSEYIDKLKRIEHNGYAGPSPLADLCKD